jgi:signal transduction histidine kinase
MKRFLPDSLFGQMLLIVLAGLVVSHAIGAWIYSADREAALRAVGGLATAQRIVNLTRLVENAPDAWRHRIIEASSDQTFRVTVLHQTPRLPANEDSGPVASAVRAYLINQLSLGRARTPIVTASEPFAAPFGRWSRLFMGHGPMMMMGGPPGLLNLEVVIPAVPAGEWLSFRTALPRTGDLFSHQFIVSMLIMALVLGGATIWAARRVTRPLAALGEAAQRLGQDVNAPAIPEEGTVETRRASHAFNEMQARVRQLIENRTRLLAAISHDLRTPLTLLRLRTETVADAEEREKMLATLADMDAMVAAALQYARDELSTEPRRTTDLTALTQSLVDDLADAGIDVTMTPAAPVPLNCQPSALKRVITNLVGNAGKYGKRAHVSITSTNTTVDIIIDDEGPGLSEEDLKRVFQPFYRVEGSRSRDTGGVGLGLAIARTLTERHGGTLTLENRPSGGLRARVSLPRA